MWAIIKFDKKKLELLKKDLKEKLGEDINVYKPKLLFKKYKNNKLINKEFNLLGDYLFCFHKNFQDSSTISKLKFSKGLKYFLNGFVQSQKEINKFIKKCKESENEEGYLSQNFYELCINSNYQFSSGPFTEMIFKIIDLQKNKINILLGDIKTTIKKNKFQFRPL
jgi:hypothetical protein|tara:strand:- start:4262 stop:4759 length:498 start_codon:yes stop_codon:yes gene_type:complete